MFNKNNYFFIPLQASGFDARYWEAKKLRFICHVEVVEIELFEGINALELDCVCSSMPRN